MSAQGTWEFIDDRGRRVTAPHRPARIVAYIQAAAALWDFGLPPVGIFGSQHDGDTPDAAKAGDLPLDHIPYFGAGGALRTDDLLATGADLLVAVTYDDERVYGLDGETAERLEGVLPTVALGVGSGRGLGEVLDRFAALARSLRAVAGDADGERAARLDRAVNRLRSAARARSGARVLALSAADAETAYLARPATWPDLRALAEHGVRLVEPPAGPGTNWATTGWTEAAALGADIVLTDVRANAAPPDALAQSPGWHALRDRAAIVPWNPEIPGSHHAHERFFDGVAQALER
ncbi:ABC transporter substrate-binding protein [Streptomyces sp. SBT349]|uniref:ABC transporter substrate-binding protein n=1 Tax=Streptomyces sp. SBT349 TaxID=1580539 RepID=UPI00066E901A|nr:ABC transporter substrate-binding protein [Streptomyces sp. SBT349]